MPVYNVVILSSNLTRCFLTFRLILVIIYKAQELVERAILNGTRPPDWNFLELERNLSEMQREESNDTLSQYPSWIA